MANVWEHEAKLNVSNISFSVSKQFLVSKIYNRPRLRSPGGGGGGALPILGHISDVRPEWVTFPSRKPADGCKFLTKNLRTGHNFDIILPGNGWSSSNLNKTYCSLVNFYCK